MLDRILTEAKVIGAADTVRVLPLPNLIRLPHDTAPRACCCASDDRSRAILGNNLELGSIAAIKNRTVVRDICVRVACAQVPACHRVTDRENIALRVEVLAQADFTERDYSHDADVQWQFRASSCRVARHGRYAV